MNTHECIKNAMDMADYVCSTYLNDLTDQEMMQRPHPSCNHINWQIGHLILSENDMIEKIKPGSMPPLPAGFAEKYSRDNCGSDDPSHFATKEELMATAKAQRAGTLAALAATKVEDFDKETGVDYAPTVGAMFNLQGSHWLMHCGQWVIVRRNLGKPVVI